MDHVIARRSNTKDCQASVRQKTARHRTEFPAEHLPVERPSQRVSVDLVESKTIDIYTTPDGVQYKYILSIIDPLTRFALLVAIHDKSNETVARVLVESIIWMFGSPEKLH